MGMHIDMTDVGCTMAARVLLDSLDDSTFISLGVLFGTDLCVLGGTKHPVCWDALKSAWRQLDQKEREKITEASTQAMLDRDLIIAGPSGRGIDALILPPCYKMSIKLRILLSAHESPAFMIATHHESRTPAVTYFQPWGTSAIVQEIPERTDGTARVASKPTGCHVQLPLVHPGLCRRRARHVGFQAHPRSPLPAEAAPPDLLLRSYRRRPPGFLPADHSPQRQEGPHRRPRHLCRLH